MTRHLTLQCLVLTLVLGSQCVRAAEREKQYQPLFSKQMLEQADPATRERLQALDERNYQRWLSERNAEGNHRRPSRAQQPQSSGGKLYRYRDAQGNVRFSDHYVEGAQEVSVAVREPSAASRAEYEKRQLEQARMLEYYNERDEQARQEKLKLEQQRANRAEREQQCRQLFLDIQDNRRGGFVSYDIGPDGERVFLSDEELSARTDEMEARYRQGCGKLPPIGR